MTQPTYVQEHKAISDVLSQGIDVCKQAMKPELLIRTYLEEVVARGRLELVEELSNADMVDEANQAFGGAPGQAGFAAHVKGFRRSIGNLNVTVERIVAGDAVVMAWWSFAGIHTGPWLGRPPTGKPIQGTVFSFFDLVGGRISRYRLFLHAEFPESVILDTSRLNFALTSSRKTNAD